MQLAQRACSYERLQTQRVAARAFAVTGAVFWAVMVFSGDYLFLGRALTASLGSALVPLVVAAVTVAVGWYLERATAIGLAFGAAAIVVWGIVAGWPMGAWLGVGSLVLLPMTASAAFFWMAARMDDLCSAQDRDDTFEA